MEGLRNDIRILKEVVRTGEAREGQDSPERGSRSVGSGRRRERENGLVEGCRVTSRDEMEKCLEMSRRRGGRKVGIDALQDGGNELAAVELFYERRYTRQRA